MAEPPRLLNRGMFPLAHVKMGMRVAAGIVVCAGLALIGAVACDALSPRSPVSGERGESNQCDRLGDASTLSTKSAADWAVKYMGVCADFDGRLVASKLDLHIVGSWDAPYGLDIAVAGSGVCLNADEYVVGWGTPVSFVGRVVGTLDVDDLQTGGRRTLPLVQCWDGNRLDLVGTPLPSADPT